MKPRCCQYCGQVIPETRLGVRLTSLKARIFDLVQRGGEDGIPGADLFDIVFGESDVQRKNLNMHILQINELIEDEGYRIVGNQGSIHSVYRLVRVAA